MGRGQSGGTGGAAGRGRGGRSGNVGVFPRRTPPGRPAPSVLPDPNDLNQHWTGKNRTVNIDDDSMATASRLFGRTVTKDQLANLVGAPDGAELKVSNQMLHYSDLEGDHRVQIKVEHPFFSSQYRTIARQSDGTLEMHNDLFKVSSQAPKGTGINVFSRQVANAKKLGIDRITTYAAKDGGYNGYYTWARFGYNRGLSYDEQTNLKLDYRARNINFDPSNIFTTNDLMLQGGSEGANWWKQNGDEGNMTFSLKKGSVSLNILRSYAAAKNVKVKF